MSYLIYGALGIFLLVFGGVLFPPMRRLLVFALQVCLGLGGLLACSFCASLAGISIGINALNTAVVTLLGPAGALLLLMLGWSLT